MLGGAAAAVDPGGPRPHRARGREDRHRADLRGRLSALLVRLSAEAGDARRPAGAHRRVLAGRRWVVETDIASCVEEIPHDRLMRAIEERICDRKLLRLLGTLAHGSRSTRPTRSFRRARSNAGALVPGGVVRRQPIATRWRESRRAASATSAG